MKKLNSYFDVSYKIFITISNTKQHTVIMCIYIYTYIYNSRIHYYYFQHKSCISFITISLYLCVLPHGKKKKVSYSQAEGRHITITLTEADTDSSGTITIPKELVEANLIPFWGKTRSDSLLKPNSFVIVELCEYESEITTAVSMKRDENGNFKFHGWSCIQTKRNFRTGDVVVFWWDKNYGSLNFELLMVANEFYLT